MRCSVNDDECVTGRLRRGMCERHYRRALHTGTTDNPRIDNLSQYEVNESGCWMWTGAVWRNGYGKTSLKIHGTRLAHRVFYVEHCGPIADGMDLDHACHNADPTCPGGWGCLHRRCCNPEHLDPVTHQVNLQRGKDARTTCAQGHDLTKPGAKRPGAGCVECWRRRYREAGARYRAKRLES